MDTLRGYSGWGGCADAFSDKPEWRTIRDANSLTPEEYTQARASTLTAYYTPGPWSRPCGTRSHRPPIQVLEPGCGTGNFMAGIPDDVAARVGRGTRPDQRTHRRRAEPGRHDPQRGPRGLHHPTGIVRPRHRQRALLGRHQPRLPDHGRRHIPPPLHDYFIERSVDALRPAASRCC
ncbi:MAG: hypothetical protein ACLS6O_00175 [Bifidobacterium sp.]